MINHARTLLLNDPVDRPDLGVFGEEYVPQDAPILPLPTYLRTVHQALMGSTPEELYQNNILRLYMLALHSIPQTRDYILGLDPRYTYSLGNEPLVREAVVAAYPAENNAPVLVGSPVSDPGMGVSAFLYEVTASGDPATVTVRETGRGKMQQAVYPDKIKLSCGADLVFSWGNPFGEWQVAVKAPLGFGVPGVLSRVNALTVSKTMMREAPEEFRRLWETQTAVESLAGYLAGVVWHLERIRNGG